MSCLICHKALMQVVKNGVRDSLNHNVAMCVSCGHVQLQPVPTIDELRTFYLEQRQRKSIHGSKDREFRRNHKLSDINRQASLIESLVPKNSSCYDIGCGEGFLVEELQKRNYQAYGTDMGHMRKGTYDVVTLFHVLEHIPLPGLFLRSFVHMAKRFLIIEVPNYDDWLIRKSTAYAEWHYQVAHVHYFTYRSILHIIDYCNFSFSSVRYFGVQRYSRENAEHWLSTGKPQIDAPIGDFNDSDIPYRQYHERKLTSDTLCFVCQT